MIEPNNISYRDTAARVVKKETGYYRYIFHEYKAEYEYLMKSGLYHELTKKGLLIEHEEIKKDTDDPKVHKLLFPAQIIFQSYPYEWSFTQWRKVMLAYLRINYISLQYGMILKDATPYNFYLKGGKAIMFDTSSFMFFKENDKWIAYRQFCEEFLSPIALMHYNGAEWSKLTMANLRGMGLSFVSKQLPIKSWFNFTTLLHIHLHSKYSGNNKTKELYNKKNKGFTLEKIKSLQKMIFKTISTWNKSYQFTNHWSNYYENDIESQEYLKDKEVIIRKWLEMIKPKSVLDLGANTGKFSFIAAEYAENVISIENDEESIKQIEVITDEKSIKNIETLKLNLDEPSPQLGILNIQTKTSFNRCASEVILALAVIHHLYFTNKMSFNLISKILKKYCKKYLIIEFIQKEDLKVQRLMSNNIDENYNEFYFTESMQNYFSFLYSKKLDNSNRVLYLYKLKLVEKDMI